MRIKGHYLYHMMPKTQYTGSGMYNRFKGRLSHHKKKYISCGITEHFLEDGHDFEADFEFLTIVKLLNPPSTIVKRRERLEE